MTGIVVISQSTCERKNETRELFEQIKPLLERGLIYAKAVKIVKGLPEDYSLSGRAWYRELLSYGKSQGYDPKVYSGK